MVMHPEILHSRRVARSPRLRIVPRAGVSMIEVLIVLGIIALLASLLLPAVQRARETARRAQCLSNLKQIGVASEAFYSQHQRYATGIIPFASQNTPRHGEANYSPHFQLLPFLDQGDLQNRFDDTENGRGTESDPPTSTVNAELLETPLAIFECPSDPARRPLNSYRICSGTSPHLGESFERGPNAALQGYRTLGLRRDATFVDGKSQTAAFAEKLAGDRNPDAYTPWRDLVYVLPWPGPFSLPDTAREGCSQPLPADPDHASYGGATWLLSGFTQTWYNHVLTPNAAIPDCAVGGPESAGAYTARSLHPGGVNTLFADGSVRFVSESIDLTTWRAVGSIAGHEVVGEF